MAEALSILWLEVYPLLVQEAAVRQGLQFLSQILQKFKRLCFEAAQIFFPYKKEIRILWFKGLTLPYKTMSSLLLYMSIEIFGIKIMWYDILGH